MGMVQPPLQSTRFQDYPRKIIAMNCAARLPKIRTFFDGGMGGKAMGLKLLHEQMSELEAEIAQNFEMRVRFAFPKTSILGADLLRSFMDNANLWKKLETAENDEQIKNLFLQAQFTDSQKEVLRKLLIVEEENGHARPIAVRSSGMSEDSERATSAGIYKTVILPNDHPDFEVRLAQLEAALKIVFASSFLSDAREYRKNRNLPAYEIGMAVVVQNLAGRLWPTKDGRKMYAPEYSFAGFSFNPFTVGLEKAEDGYFNLALGLGPGVVENSRTSVRVNMKRPDPPAGMRDGTQALLNAPEYFWALMMNENAGLPNDDYSFLEKMQFAMHGSQELVRRHASTYQIESNEGGKMVRILDSIPFAIEDPPLIVKFHKLLTKGFGPSLAEIVSFMNDSFRRIYGNKPVDFEGAGDICTDENGQFVNVIYPLQVRVQGITGIKRLDKLPPVEEKRVVLRAGGAIGQSGIKVNDVLFIPPEAFNFRKSAIIGQELGGINTGFGNGRKYLLLAPGRVCSQDETLGIQGSFATVSNAAAIGEGLAVNVDPSGGAHIFQNIVENGMAYFSFPQHAQPEKTLRRMAAETQQLGKYVTHLRFETPITIEIDKEGNLIAYQ